MDWRGLVTRLKSLQQDDSHHINHQLTCTYSNTVRDKEERERENSYTEMKELSCIITTVLICSYIQLQFD